MQIDEPVDIFIRYIVPTYNCNITRIRIYYTYIVPDDPLHTSSDEWRRTAERSNRALRGSRVVGINKYIVRQSERNRVKEARTVQRE